MPNYAKMNRIEHADLANSGAGDKVPVCICVDTSFSMLGEKIDQANEGIRSFVESTSADTYGQDSVDLCVISFGGEGVRVELKYTIVQSIRGGLHPLRAVGGSKGTPMGEAVLKALELTEERCTQYRIDRRKHSKPWIVIISDGAATDDISAAIRKIQQKLRDRAIKVQCIGLGDGSETAQLEQFLPPSKRVERWDALKIGNFFSLLSTEALRLSEGADWEDDSI